MISVAPHIKRKSSSQFSAEKIIQSASEGKTPEIFTNIYRDDCNIAIWKRQVSSEVALASSDILKIKPKLQMAKVVSTESVYTALNHALGESDNLIVLKNDIVQLVEMYCCLFDLAEVGLRLSALDAAMCPRFHFDRIPCRLVTTYHGKATDWLPHHFVDRSKLGNGNQGQPDEQSGLFNHKDDIQQLTRGDVALLKGEFWQGNEGAGLVHRSPPVLSSEYRLLLTLDSI
jgi:hypothetical protein